MRIGPQLYGFQGFEVKRINSAATSSSSAATSAAVKTIADSSKNLSRLKELVTDLRQLAAKPVTNETEAAIYDQQIAEVRRQVEYLTISEPQTYEISRTNISGANPSQVSEIQLQKYNSSTPLTLAGEVTVAAATAKLSIAGDSHAQATEDASYTLTTERGVFQIQFTGGEAIADIAARITAQHETTGVNAMVEGTNLVLRSDKLGSAAQIMLQRNDVSPTIVSGQNTQQISSINVVSQTAGTSDTLTGSVISQAAVAELIYQGAVNQTIAGTAAFRLTGSAGSTLVTVTKGESLATVANRLNQQSSNTGVIVSQENNTLRFKSTNQGANATVRIDQVVQAETISTSGRNAAQVPTFAVNSITRGAEDTISGQVLSTAGKANLTLQGSAGGTVISSGTFELRGNLGTSNISITKDETLSAVVSRINNLASSTGVTGRVQSNQIVLESAGIGSAAEVHVNLLSLPYTVATSGRNSAQLGSFDVQSFTDGATQTFTGSVTQAAEVGYLAIEGKNGKVDNNSTFTLTGNTGSRQFTTTKNQTLANLATAVNAQTTNTGIAALVSGDNLYLYSNAYGSAQRSTVTVTAGSLDISGNTAGSGNTYTDYGRDAKATINGTVRTGAGNNFAFSDTKGSYTFSTVQGYTGSLSTITVTSTAGTFTLQGGDGSGNARGTDATATINGVQRTGVGNDFSLTTSKGQYSLSFAAGFTGTFSPITAKSTLDEFSISGGDPAGTAVGKDFVANINGTEYRGLSNTITHNTSNGSYELTIATDFIGPFAPITISTSAGPQISGGDGSGRSTGVDAQAELNGRHFTAIGNAFQYDDPELSLSFEVAAGFSGQIDSLTVAITNEIVHQNVSRVIEKPTTSPSPRTSTSVNKVVARNQPSALDALLQEIESLSTPNSDEDGANAGVETPVVSEKLLDRPSKPQLVSTLYQQLAQQTLLNVNPMVQQLLNGNVTLARNALDVSG
jgi:hypothetical protein